jgi:hypothetical protein
VDLGEPFEVVAVLGSASEALEAYDAAQTGDEELGPIISRAHRAFLDGVVVERWESSAQDVDDSRARLCSQVFMAQILAPDHGHREWPWRASSLSHPVPRLGAVSRAVRVRRGTYSQNTP